MKVYWEALVDLFYPEEALPGEVARVEPPFCQRCGEPFSAAAETHIVCSNCSGRRWHIEAARAACRAEGVVRDCIHGFKYRGQFHHLQRLGQWLVEGFDRHYGDQSWDGLVPVPLHWRRRWLRGFNQAGELARWLSRARRIPVWNGLRRYRPTGMQARLRRSERLRNMAGVFALKRGFDATGLRLLVIDDVFTTGATVDACAAVLKRSGAREVRALTVARG